MIYQISKNSGFIAAESQKQDFIIMPILMIVF